MHYTENREQAGEYLRIALGFITRFNLPADPTCYSVWYEYASGKNLQLKKIIDQALANSAQINLTFVKKLYKDYIAEKDRNITEKLLKELKEIISGISRYAIETTGDIAGNGQRLERLAGQLDKNEDIDSLTRIMDQIIQEAKNLVQSGKSLQGRMTSSSEELANLRKKLALSKKEAETDALTRLLNRRGFEARLQPLLEDPKAEFSIIMLDLDHFKKVNDTFGHLVGDSILKTLADLLTQQTKGKDTLARFGGEEFILMLPETKLEQAWAVAESIRKKLASKEWKNKATGQSMGQITISLGVSQYRPGESKNTLIHRADKALYAAKAGGRNRVVMENQLD